MEYLKFLVRIVVLVLIVGSNIEGAFIQPDRHTLPSGLESLNGSDQNGGCNCFLSSNTVCGCLETDSMTTTSALIDGVCPTEMIDTATGNWAHDFFTISRNGRTSVMIGFRFPDNSFELLGVQLKLFNCPSEGIAVHTINVYESSSFPAFQPFPGDSFIGSKLLLQTDVSCDQLTNIIIPTLAGRPNQLAYFIEFQYSPSDASTAIYIAEAQFSNTGIAVPTEPPITTQPPPEEPTTMKLSTTTQFIGIRTSINPISVTASNTRSTASTSAITVPTSTISLSQIDTQLISRSTVATAPIANSVTITSSLTLPTDQTTTLSESEQQFSTTIPLAIIIVALFLVIVIGIAIVGLCFLKKRSKKHEIVSLQGAIIEERNGRGLELNPVLNRESLVVNQMYSNTLKTKDFEGADGYFDISINAGNEPVYNTVGECQERVESFLKSTEENMYSVIKEVSDKQPQNIPPYTAVGVKEPPEVPRKTSDLYRDLELERDFNSVPQVLVSHEDNVETVDSCMYQSTENLIRSESTQSGIAVLSEPLVRQMDANPTYSTPDIVNAVENELTPDVVYTNPDAIEQQSTYEDIDHEGSNKTQPKEPVADGIYSLAQETGSPVLNTQNIEEVYTDPDKENTSDEIYTDIDAPQDLAPKSDEIYTDVNSAKDSTVARQTDAVYSEPNVTPTTPQYENQSAIDSEVIYSDADAEKPSAVCAIYDTVYEDPSVAAIFDPDTEYDYMSDDNDDDMLLYAPIYSNMSSSSKKPLDLVPGNIKMIRVLGSGCFGEVLLANTVGLSLKDLGINPADEDKGKSIEVAVKTLKATASKTTKESFDRECRFMSRLDHPHVIRFLGVCSDKFEPYIMMEYLRNGDLSQYLQGFDCIVENETENPKQITIKTLITMCAQISDAMRYLASRNYIHRDLAARNCLVSDSNTVKLADFGMSRSLYESHYYIIKGRAILPVRWMSSECFYGKFSVWSDVWAFGVTMWEIFTLAKQLPYEGMADTEIAKDALNKDKRIMLSKTEECPQEVFDVIAKCWKHKPKERATFDQIYTELDTLLHKEDLYDLV